MSKIVLLDAPTGGPRTLIDELLDEQQQLTAIDRFTRRHERDALPAQARYYRDLIPLNKPRRGEQYAFAVDLDICTGCKACVSACHSLNGLDDDEIWRNVGLLHGGTIEEPYQQTVTTACHHCVEPACLLGCPVRAYEKDAETGIVRHLDDQCIGCQYCVLKCPYDVPKYSEKRGIVRKCDMCHDRLSAGEAPACVQACPSGAITIRIVSAQGVSESIAPGGQLLPGAFDSSYTRPTTRYTTRRAIPKNARPGDDGMLRLEHAHWPLIWMLALTQIAAGIYFTSAALAIGNNSLFEFAKAPLSIVAFTILNLGLGVSVLHLGRPWGAWRAFLGLRTSWMSREILAFGIFAAGAAACTAASVWNGALERMPLLLTLLTAALGIVGVFCSAMIYIDTRRAFWNRYPTFTRFFGTTFLLGSAGAAATLAWHNGAFVILAIIATVIRTILSGWEVHNFRSALRDIAHPNHHSTRVIWSLRRPLLWMWAFLFVGATAFGLLTLGDSGMLTAACATLSFLLTFAMQIIERYFFFVAVVAPRMPGPSISTAATHA